MTQRTTLADAQQLLLEQYVEDCLPGRVDYRTGEILEERVYASQPYETDRSALSPCFTACTSHAALSRYMDGVDRRTLVLVNDCRRIYDLDKGNHHLYQRRIGFTSTQLVSLNRLVSRLDYANAIITTPTKLAASLCLHPKNIYRYLRTLKGMVRVLGPSEGMAQGSIKVLVSPAYGYRYPRAELATARAASLASWYRPALLQ